LTTILFADDQVIMTASKDFLQKLVYQLSKIALAYNVTISTAKARISTLEYSSTLDSHTLEAHHMPKQKSLKLINCLKLPTIIYFSMYEMKQ
jgi:hypothetical protein